MAGEYTLSVIMTAQDRASGVVSGFLQHLGPIGGALAAIGGVAIGFGVASVKAASDFQSSMSKVQAYAGYTKQQTDQMGQSILQLAPQIGESPKALADALYMVASAGFKGSQSLQILRYAGMTAAAANTDATTVTKDLVSSLSSLGLGANQSGNIMDELNQTVANGLLTWDTYGSVVGKLAGTVSTAGGSAKLMQTNFGDLNAALDVYSNGGITAHQASMWLSADMSLLDGKTSTLTKNAAKLGVQFNATQFQTMNFGQQLQYLNTITDGNRQKLVALLGGNSTVANSIQYLNNHYKEFSSTLSSITAGMQNGKTTQEKFAVAQQTLAFKVQQAKASFQSLLITVGNALLPVISNLIGQIAPAVSQFTNWITTSGALTTATNVLKNGISILATIIGTTITVIKDIVQWSNQHRGVVLAVAAALTAFYVPALIKSGVEAVTAGVKTATQFVSNIVKAGVEGYKAAGKLAMLIGNLIKTGAEAAIAGAKTAAQFVGSLIKAGAAAVASGAKIAASFIANVVKAGVEAVVTGAKIAAQFVASMIKAGAQAVIAGAQFVGSLIPALISIAADGIAAVVAAMPALIGGLISATVAAWGFTAALLANPITWIVLAIVALIAIIVLLATHWKQVTAAIGAACTWVGQQFSRLGSWVHQQIMFIGAIFSWLGTQIHNKIQQVVTFFDAFKANLGQRIAAIIAFFQQLPGKIGHFFEQLEVNVVNKLISLKTAAQQKVQDVITTIVNFFKNLPSQALQWGKDMIQGFINGIMNMAGGVVNAVKNIGGKIASFLHFSKPDIGPLANSDKWMPDFGNTLVLGLNNIAPRLQAAAIKAAAAVSAPFSTGANVAGQPSHVFDIIGSNYTHAKPPVHHTTTHKTVHHHYHITVNPRAGKFTSADAKDMLDQISRLNRMSGQQANTASGRRY